MKAFVTSHVLLAFAALSRCSPRTVRILDGPVRMDG